MNQKLLKCIASVTIVGSVFVTMSGIAHAVSYHSPFGDAPAVGYLHNSSDGHYIGWFPVSAWDCDHVVWYLVGPPVGLQVDLTIWGGAGNDQLSDWSAVDWGEDICGYPAYNVTYNSHTVYLYGQGGADYLIGFQSPLRLYGDAGDDTLVAYQSGSLWMYGGDGNDNLCGCSTYTSNERYDGGSGTNCFYDGSGSWQSNVNVSGGYCCPC